jgi:hypothetical protein
MHKTPKDTALIISLCKDIARHASQLEAENQGTDQSIERYVELKDLLLSHFMQGEDNFETILTEVRKSWAYASGWEDKGALTIAAKNHAICMLDYFMTLINEIKKEELI